MAITNIANTTNAERAASATSWTTKPSTRTTNAFEWRDSALIKTVTHDSNTGSERRAG